MRLGLCGRGPGFIPAGDDFIGGSLAIFNWIRISLKIDPRIVPGPEYRKLTTWTSFKLMECNARGLVDIEYDWWAQEKPGEKPSQSRLDDLEWQKMKTRGQISYH